MQAAPGILRPAVAKILDAMADRPIAEVEAVIEAARRILWMSNFTGVDGAAAAVALNAPSSARYAAAEIAGACASSAEPLLAAERLLLELRLQLYTAAYGSPSIAHTDRAQGLSNAPPHQAEVHSAWWLAKPDLSRRGRARAA